MRCGLPEFPQYRVVPFKIPEELRFTDGVLGYHIWFVICDRSALLVAVAGSPLPRAYLNSQLESAGVVFDKILRSGLYKALKGFIRPLRAL